MQWPSVKFIAADTGINRNRLFRIAQGHEMKLGEYQIFQTRIDSIKNHLHRRKKNFKEELKELIAFYIDHPLDESPHAYLKVRKSWMTLTEERILASRMAEIEEFIESVNKEKREHPLSWKKPEKNLIVFWGSKDLGGNKGGNL